MNCGLSDTNPTPRHAAALNYAAKGVPVFPCVVGGKQPACAHGFQDRTTDVAKINAWWGEADYNLAIVPADTRWTIVDVDSEEGKAAARAFGCDPTVTYTVKSPHGWHLYYGGISPRKIKLSPGLDILSSNGYALVPPSIVDGIPYAVFERAGPDVIDLPAGVTAALIREPAEKRLEVAPGCEVDAAHVIERGRRYLEGTVANDGAPTMGSRNNQCVTLANRLGDFGLSEEAAASLLQEEWAAHGQAPDEAIEDIVASAYKSRENAIGCDYKPPQPSVEEKFSEYLKGLRSTATPGAYQPPPPPPARMTMRELMTYASSVPEDLWHGLLPRQLVTLLYADGEMGKTMLAEHLAAAVAGGLGSLFGHGLKQMPVVMVLCEDRYERVKLSIVAICLHLGIKDSASLPIIWRCTPADPLLAVVDDKGRAELQPFLCDVAKDVAELGECLLVLDTVSDIAELNENLRLPVNTLLKKVLQPFCAELGATVLVNCHPSGEQMKTGRGTSGTTQWRNGVRSLLTLKAMAELSDRRILSNRREDGGKASYGGATAIYLSMSGPLFSVASAAREMPVGTIDPRLLKIVIEHLIDQAVDRPVQRPRTRDLNKAGEIPYGDWIKEKFARQSGLTVSNKVIWEHAAHAERERYLEYRDKFHAGKHGGAGYYKGSRDVSELGPANEPGLAPLD